jgi:hypothetical protein
MHIWRIAYEAYRTKSEIDPTGKFMYEDVSDEEIFTRHNSKGREIEGLNLDSEEDFLKWEGTNNPYHCLDIAYARVHLSPHKMGECWDDEKIPVPNGQWYFSLYFSVYGYSQDVINMLEALCHAGTAHFYMFPLLSKFLWLADTFHAESGRNLQIRHYCQQPLEILKNTLYLLQEYASALCRHFDSLPCPQ